MCTYTGVRDLRLCHFSPACRPFQAQIDMIQCPLFRQLQYQYNVHQMTMMNNTILLLETSSKTLLKVIVGKLFLQLYAMQYVQNVPQ